jgi:hypothetical protein
MYSRGHRAFASVPRGKRGKKKGREAALFLLRRDQRQVAGRYFGMIVVVPELQLHAVIGWPGPPVDGV